MNKVIHMFQRSADCESGLRTRIVRCARVLPFVLLSACAGPGVYQPGDAHGDPHGIVKPLNTYLSDEVTDVKLVFIHGVGDFCPGYALSGDSDDGWLGNDTAKKIGLNPNGAVPVTELPIYSNEFLTPSEGNPHPYDEQSYVALRTQNFTYPPSKIRVEAIEVTWSPLTQWVKNTRLRDDFTKPGIFSCVPINQGEQAQPPSRLALNRLVKEDILDRKLADSAIYMGQYHTVMQLGLADALCHAFTGQPILPANPLKPNPPCDWSKATVDPKTRYVFVTHSLGSRLLYDTLLGLLGKNPPGVDQSALATEFPGAESYLRDMLAHTPVIYMMANQLTFLGMANITAQDTAATANRKPAGAPVELQLSETEKGQPGAQGENEKCKDVICFLALAKAESVQTQVLKAVPAPTVSTTLDVVAFSDTDDLLTWSIPKEYEHEPLRIVNVYVQNAARFLIIEDPVSAHGGYFKSGAVWDVIRCGAQGTTVNCN